MNSASQLGSKPNGNRFLIVNADDFGHSVDVNRGIIEAHQGGIVTSASLMSDRPAAAAAAAYGRERPCLSLGLHINLGQWVYQDGNWISQYQLAPMDDVAALADAVSQQLEAFRSLTGRNPAHIDSHQHVHREEPIRSILLAEARRLDVPLRSCTPGIIYCGAYYGQTGKGFPLPDAITADALIAILPSLSSGITELACHPGLGNSIDSVYCSEREQEVKALCDPRVRRALADQGIQLCSFNDIADPWRKAEPPDPKRFPTGK